MEGLSLDNVMTGEEAAALFSPEESQGSSETKTETSPEGQTEEKQEKQQETTEVNAAGLFAEDKPESVGSAEGKDKGKKDTSSTEETSPNFYSSLAKAFAEDGVFQDLNDETISKVKDAESFMELVEEKIQAQLDDRQKRIDEALTFGIEPTQIQRFENSLKILNDITDEAIEEEGEKGETLRKNIIYEDYIQRGFSKERAAKAAERSVAAGTDIEDAKESLQSCKEQIDKSYKEAVQNAKDAKIEEQNKIKERSENLKKTILSDKKAFGEMEVDAKTRQRVFDTILKPAYTDPETGERLTALQKYEREHSDEFLKNIGFLYVMTDGFKSLDGLVKGKVKKEIGKGLKELEHTLNNTSRNTDGSLKFTSGVGSDPESYFRKYTLDV